MDKVLPKGDYPVEPDIGPFGFYCDSFFELGTCRNGMSVSSIPFTAIIEFAKIYDVGDFDEFLYLIRRLDDTYVEFHSKDDSDNASKNDTDKS